ncbi:hypothetical protein S245_017217, partial [Arachis hypogaea]
SESVFTSVFHSCSLLHKDTPKLLHFLAVFFFFFFWGCFFLSMPTCSFYLSTFFLHIVMNKSNYISRSSFALPFLYSDQVLPLSLSLCSFFIGLVFFIIYSFFNALWLKENQRKIIGTYKESNFSIGVLCFCSYKCCWF